MSMSMFTSGLTVVVSCLALAMLELILNMVQHICYVLSIICPNATVLRLETYGLYSTVSWCCLFLPVLAVKLCRVLSWLRLRLFRLCQVYPGYIYLGIVFHLCSCMSWLCLASFRRPVAMPLLSMTYGIAHGLWSPMAPGLWLQA